MRAGAVHTIGPFLVVGLALCACGTEVQTPAPAGRGAAAAEVGPGAGGLDDLMVTVLGDPAEVFSRPALSEQCRSLTSALRRGDTARAVRSLCEVATSYYKRGLGPEALEYGYFASGFLGACSLLVTDDALISPLVVPMRVRQGRVWALPEWVGHPGFYTNTSLATPFLESLEHLRGRLGEKQGPGSLLRSGDSLLSADDGAAVIDVRRAASSGSGMLEACAVELSTDAWKARAGKVLDLAADPPLGRDGAERLGILRSVVGVLSQSEYAPKDDAELSAILRALTEGEPLDARGYRHLAAAAAKAPHATERLLLDVLSQGVDSGDAGTISALLRFASSDQVLMKILSRCEAKTCSPEAAVEYLLAVGDYLNSDLTWGFLGGDSGVGIRAALNTSLKVCDTRQTRAKCVRSVLGFPGKDAGESVESGFFLSSPDSMVETWFQASDAVSVYSQSPIRQLVLGMIRHKQRNGEGGTGVSGVFKDGVLRVRFANDGATTLRVNRFLPVLGLIEKSDGGVGIRLGKLCVGRELHVDPEEYAQIEPGESVSFEIRLERAAADVLGSVGNADLEYSDGCWVRGPTQESVVRYCRGSVEVR